MSILIHGTVALKLSRTVVIAFPLLLFLFLGTYNSLFVVVLASLSIRADGIDPLTNSNNNVIVARDNDLSLLLLASKFSTRLKVCNTFVRHNLRRLKICYKLFIYFFFFIYFLSSCSKVL